VRLQRRDDRSARRAACDLSIDYGSRVRSIPTPSSVVECFTGSFGATICEPAVALEIVHRSRLSVDIFGERSIVVHNDASSLWAYVVCCNQFLRMISAALLSGVVSGCAVVDDVVPRTAVMN